MKFITSLTALLVVAASQVTAQVYYKKPDTKEVNMSAHALRGRDPRLATRAAQAKILAQYAASRAASPKRRRVKKKGN